LKLGGGERERHGGRESGWKRVPRRRKKGGEREREREREKERKRDPCSNHPPIKNEILFPVHGSVSLLLVTTSSLSLLTARFPRSLPGQTLFLDIHPQKCNDRPFPVVKLSGNGPGESVEEDHQ
jgi:hypothetical protein